MIDSIDGDDAVETWRGICLGRRYLCIAIAFSRRKWISSFCLYDAMILTNRTQIDKENDDGVIMLGGEPESNGGQIVAYWRISDTDWR